MCMTRRTRSLLLLALILCVVVVGAWIVRELTGPATGQVRDVVGGAPEATASMEAAFEEVRAALDLVPGVSMIGESRENGQAVILVGVESGAYVQDVQRRVPARVRDVPIVVRVTGAVEAQQ